MAIISQTSKFPAVVYFQYDWVSWKKREGKIIDYFLATLTEYISLRFSTKIIATTPSLKEKAIERGAKKSKVFVVPNHVNTSIFKPNNKDTARKEIGMELSEKNMLFAGRFVPQKNLFNLLESLLYLKNIKLYLAGDGELKNDLRKFAEKKRVSDRIIFLGTIKQEELVTFLNACDIFVFPSLYEGHPKALIEAMATGCTIAASNVEGNNEVIQDNKTGLLFDPSDSKEIVGKIEFIMKHPEIANKLKENALKASKEYDLDVILKKEKRILLSA
jgi:glycosyltransferase involved in cell wall biosynthesis